MPLSFRPVVALALVLSSAAMATGASAQEEAPTLAEIVEAWLASPHADRSSEAFTHWDEDGEIPGSCAVCHSSPGAIDYVRTPMTTPGMIDHPVAPGTSVDCAVCHNQSATDLRAVPYPSGVVVDSFETSAICTVCHQGRASGQTITTQTSGMDDDVVVGDLSFINVHYAPSASTMLGSVARVGYEYPDKSYKGQFTHVPGLNTCTDCHGAHDLTVELNACTTCHAGAESFTDIRLSPTDFDGDGDTSEGIAGPIATLHARLLDAIQLYAAEVLSAPVIYADAYPYFFADSDGDGIAGPGEAVFPNRYQTWTPRLLKAAYNYQLVEKDAGIYTHNPHYALQLLHDSIESLSERVEIDMADLSRP